MTQQTVLTPDGAFTATWGDGVDADVVFSGSEEGIRYFRNFLSTAMVTGNGGMQLSADGLSPADLYTFCQSREYGVSVFLSIEDEMAMDEVRAHEARETALAIANSDDPAAALGALLDAVSPMERIKLLRDLSEATAGLQGATSPIARIKAAKAVADALAALGEGGREEPPGVDPEDDGLSDDPASPNYRYKDTGHISGSRKEIAAQALREAGRTGKQVRTTDIDWKAVEENPRAAKELIVKSILFGKTDWDALRDSGMDPGAGFLIDKVFASVGPEPTNAIPVATVKTISRDMKMVEAMTAMDRESPEAMAQTRKDYALGLESIRARMEACKTVGDVEEALAEIRSELFGATLSSEQADAMSVLEAELDALQEERRIFENERGRLFGLSRAKESEVHHLRREQRNRASRKWKPDPEIDAKIAANDAEVKALHAAAVAFADSNPKFGTTWDHQSGLPKSPHDLAVSAVMAQIREIRNAAFQYNLLSNPVSRAWLSLGERFLMLVNFRSAKGSDAFAGHYTNAKSGRIKDWSWSDKGGGKGPAKKPKAESVTFQLKVADEFVRTGGRNVSAASTTELKSMLGLRDVQSGNWVLRDQVSAKFHVEQTAAAMSDMADVLGIDMKYLGLGGRLAMAFGARGRGGKGAARAHYEPVERVINLTKMGGGGALGHELFHAIDNLMPAIAGVEGADKDSFASKHPRTMMPPGAVADAFAALNTAMTSGSVRLSESVKITEKDVATAKYNIDRGMVSGLRADIKAAGSAEKAVMAVDAKYAGVTYSSALRDAKRWRVIAAAYYATPKQIEAGRVVMRTGAAVSSFMAEAQFLDEGKTGSYWSTVEEMAARAFQSYLEDRLADQGRRNDYLSVFADNKFHVDPLFGIEWKPYPEGEERTRINAAFDRLFEALRESKLFEAASQNKALLDSIFGPENDGVMDGISPMERVRLVKALGEANASLGVASTPIARIKAAKEVSDALAALGASTEDGLRAANANDNLSQSDQGQGTGMNTETSIPEGFEGLAPAETERLNSALAALDAGFTTKTDKARAIDLVKGVYYAEREKIKALFDKSREAHRASGREPGQAESEADWAISLLDLHNWRPKHSAMAVQFFPEVAPVAGLIEKLVELRGKLHAAEVTKAPSKAEKQRDQVRVASAGGSLNPELNDIVAQLNALKPEVADEFRVSITSQIERVLLIMQTGSKEEQAEFFKRSPSSAQLVQFIEFDGSYRDKRAVGIDTQKVVKESVAYADQQVGSLILKLVDKVGNLSSVAIQDLRAGSMQFRLTGKLDGKEVTIRQSRIINSSATGTLFHQWPALIYVDGKLTSEAQYRGMGGGTEKATIKVGSKVRLRGKVVEVTGIRFAVARGIGPAVNGTSVEHVFWMEGGKERGYPKRYARLVEG